MSDSPAKRRKTSPTTAVPVDAPATAATLDSRTYDVRPSVSHRRSFQSPTRSSLARSHPEVLSHVLNRSPTRSPQRRVSRRSEQDRVFGLRDRKALRPSLSDAAASPSASAQPQSSFPTLSPRRRSGAIQAFAAPPRRISRRLEPTDVDLEASRGTQESSLTTPTRQNNPDDQLVSELDSATRDAEGIPLLEPSLLPDDYGEPELPPTPTELGLERRPQRTKSPLSSPSSRYKQRTERKEGLGRSSLRFDKSMRLSPEDAPEQEEISDDVRKQKEMKAELTAQLERLKTDVAQLETWTRRTEQPLGDPEPETEAVRSLVSLLASSNPSTVPPSSLISDDPPLLSSLISSLLPFSAKAVPVKSRPASPDPINPFVLKESVDSKPHLTIFAPLDLSYSTSISAPIDSESRLNETHDITLTAPFPFPRNLYSVSVTFKTDLGSQRVISIALPKSTSIHPRKIPLPLHDWMKSRLASPLLGLDIAGLSWGISRYWEASICRARVWSRLKQVQEMIMTGRWAKIRDEPPLIEPLRRSEVRSVIPHLHRVSMIFNGPKNSKRALSSKKLLLLSCPLVLDEWTGEAQLIPEISISAPDLAAAAKRVKLERDMKRLFGQLLRDNNRAGGAGVVERNGFHGHGDAEAIVRATEGVIGVFYQLDNIFIARSNGHGHGTGTM